ncbi:MAG TPA: FAD-binding oxidoreductase [Jatrophihabitans sp.]|uniref:FAD-binding oxidoreductase n=1 Tax=Jatrophihabitans sp. TaxID=1932789 RepID=UPI002DFAB065|nr:FAD-binding oxidoreductase [Jatrophihabitans sp.]
MSGGLSPSDLDALAAAVDGEVLLPDHADFDAAHQVWNRNRQLRPAVILAGTTPRDVALGIAFARTHDLPLAVRGGGYTPSGTASCENGLMLDLRPMNGVSVDPRAGTAVVSAGATWGELDPATQAFGLAVPGLPVSRIGVAGSTIGGGYGHLRRAYGLACDNLVSADVVTADGRLVTASGDQNTELLWGLRGGGGNFGVVTSLTFRLRPLPGPVLSGALVFAAEHAERLVRFYRDWTAGLREDVSTRLSLISARQSSLEAQGVDRPTGPVVAVTVVCVGPPSSAEALVRPLRTVAPVLRDLLVAQPYVAVQSRTDAAYPAGAHADVASVYLPELDDRAVDAVVEQFHAVPAGSCELHIDHMGGAVSRVAPMATAAPNRLATYLVGGMVRWSDEAEAPPQREWLAATRARLLPSSVGGPHVGMDMGHVPSAQAYGVDRHLRLAALKRSWDPDNVFTRNVNVAPLG